jgi:pimeloyl-ACP methyl ester carboxylesterase
MIPTVLDEHRTVDGVRLAFGERGTGEPVVFLHGTPSHSYIWRNVLPVVEAAGYRVLAYDLLGYGCSERPVDRDTSVTAQAILFEAVLSELGLAEVNLVGHDLGGAIGQIVATARPELIRRMVLVDTPCYDSWPSPTWRKIVRERLDGYQLMDAREFEAMLTRQLAMTVADPERMSGDVLDAYLAPYRSPLGRWSFFEHQVRHYDSAHTERIVPGLHRLTMPVRIVWGAEDRWQPLSYARRLAADIPGAELRVLDGAGHFPMEDRPERVAAEILAGLSVA